jgi:4-diphosphocytidyl-2-C-methyl-D-erythritol kinase
MGGGSADAAATIRLADAAAPVDPELASELAVQLGADVPSQLAPGLALGLGAGERVTAAAPLAPHAFVIMPLPTELPTAAVFARADEMGLPRSAEDLAHRRAAVEEALQGGGRWPDELTVNDLEPAACALCPDIERALRDGREAGADVTFVTGSGPTVVAVFWGDEAHGRADDAEAELAARYPEAYAADPVTADFGTPQHV